MTEEEFRRYVEDIEASRLFEKPELQGLNLLQRRMYEICYCALKFGFMESGEGFNGEYGTPDDKVMVELFERWLSFVDLDTL